MSHESRRAFLSQIGGAGLTTSVLAAVPWIRPSAAAERSAARCRFGLVTYLWGQHLTLPDLLKACEQSQVLGVELRTTHRHGVEPHLNQTERKQVRRRFNDSPVTLVGLGSNERFDSPDAAKVQAALKATKAFIELSHDVGGTGVKVKGDRFYGDVPREKTLDQVVTALRELGDYGAGYGQQVRLEIHGGFAEIPIHHQIMKAVDHPNVRSCWNSNRQDLQGLGLEHNFNLVKDYFGQTAHVRVLDSQDYPFEELIELFVASDFDGWVMLEAHGELKAGEVALKLTQQRQLFERYVQAAQKKL